MWKQLDEYANVIVGRHNSLSFSNGRERDRPRTKSPRRQDFCAKMSDNAPPHALRSASEMHLASLLYGFYCALRVVVRMKQPHAIEI